MNNQQTDKIDLNSDTWYLDFDSKSDTIGGVPVVNVESHKISVVLKILYFIMIIANAAVIEINDNLEFKNNLIFLLIPLICFIVSFVKFKTAKAKNAVSIIFTLIYVVILIVLSIAQ